MFNILDVAYLLWGDMGAVFGVILLYLGSYYIKTASTIFFKTFLSVLNRPLAISMQSFMRFLCVVFFVVG